MATKTLLLTICVLVLCGILTAGLWPFHAPKNEVRWSKGRNGVLFGKHGTIVSASPFEARASEPLGRSCSVEMWLAPNRLDSEGMILVFDPPGSRATPFAVRQFRGGLVVERGSQTDFAKRAGIYVGDVFKSLTPVFVTITSGETGVAIYVDSTLVKKSPNFTFLSWDLTGQLVVGNAASATYTWPGQFKGLAIYDRELSASEVSQHFENWTENRQTELADTEGIVALYPFDEGSGKVIHSKVTSAPDLVIPERYFVLNKWFLEPFWREYRSRLSYWKDVGVNIVGFIPLGFFFCSYLSLVRRIEHPALATIAFGFVVSLTIEVLQALLPTRDSGTTDLITNTFGTALGVISYGWSMKHNWYMRLGISIDSVGETREELQLVERL
jgi:VanZ like protein/concanavalin A-like lectin/glucanase superfamily protein